MRGAANVREHRLERPHPPLKLGSLSAQNVRHLDGTSDDAPEADATSASWVRKRPNSAEADQTVSAVCSALQGWIPCVRLSFGFVHHRSAMDSLF